MKLNGKEFPVHALDTVVYIIKTIANKRDTLPSLLLFTDAKGNVVTLTLDIIQDKKTRLHVVDIRKILSTDNNIHIYFNKYANGNQDMLERYIGAWGLGENANDGGDPADSPHHDKFKASLNQITDSGHVLYQQLDTYVRVLETTLETRKDDYKQRNIDIKIDNKFNPTAFIQGLIKYNVVIKRCLGKPYQMRDIFDQMSISANIPFCYYNTYFKYSSHINKLPYEWTNLTKTINEDEMLFVLSMHPKKKITSSINPTDYLVIKIHIDRIPESKDVKKYVQLLISHDASKISKDSVKSRAINAITNAVEHTTINIDVRGTFYYPDLKLNATIFKHIVMIDPKVRGTLQMYINEESKTTKDHNDIRIYSNHPNTGDLTANWIQEKTEEKKFRIKFGVLKAKNMRSINTFIHLQMNLLLSIYNNQYNTIYKQYVDVGIKLKHNVVDAKESITTIRNRQSWYYSQYPIQCLATKQWTIVSKAKADEMKKTGNGDKVMPYPRESEGKQQYYTCTNSKFPYIGLIEVKDPDIPLKYVPCCFTKKNTKYQDQYFNDAPAVAQSTSCIITDRQLFYNKSSYIAPNINNMLYMSKIYPVIKIGATSPNKREDSLLNCMNKIFKKTVTRQQLATPLHAVLCKQELYEYSVSDIQKKIYDIKKKKQDYLSPKLFTRLMEHVFACRIILFDNKNVTGSLVKNRYKYHSYRNTTTNKCVVILHENYTKLPNHPICEIVARRPDREQYIMKFPLQDAKHGIQYLIKLDDKYNTSYRLDIHGIFTPIQHVNVGFLGPLVVEQHIDASGKGYGMNVIFNSKHITLYTSSFQPLFKPITTQVYVCTKQTAIDFLAHHKIHHENCNGKIGNTSFYINFKQPTDSVYLQYKKYKILGKYFMNAILFHYSTYCNKRKLDTASNVQKYVNTINIDSKLYDNINSIQLNKQFIVDTKETKQRLSQHLATITKYNPNRVKNYYKTPVHLPAFNPQQKDVIIVRGLNQTYNVVKKVNRKLYTTVDVLINGPYYISHPDLHYGTIHIAMNIKNITNVNHIMTGWQKHTILYRDEVPDQKHNIMQNNTCWYNVYEMDLDTLKLTNKSPGTAIYKNTLLQYVINNTTYYTVLLLV